MDIDNDKIPTLEEKLNERWNYLKNRTAFLRDLLDEVFDGFVDVEDFKTRFKEMCLYRLMQQEILISQNEKLFIEELCKTAHIEISSSR